MTGTARTPLIRTALLCAAAATVTATLATVSGPASAATCATLGHAYYIQQPSGFNYMSGFEGDERYGVTTITARRGDRFELGGNGIKPGTVINFSAVRGMFGGTGNLQPTTKAGSNCVIDQTKNRFMIGNVPNGTYTITADYTGGNTGKFVFFEPVVKVKVVG